MKIKIPSVKKNKKDTQPEGPVFDMTGGSGNAGTDHFSASSPVEAAPAKEPGKKSIGKRIKKGSGKNVLKGVGKKMHKRTEKSAPKEAAAAIMPDPSASLLLQDEDGFSVNVRNSEPIIKCLSVEKGPQKWTKDLQLNIASAVIVLSLFALLLMAGETPELLFFILPGFAVYMLIAELGTFEKEKLQLYIGAVMGVALIATLVIFRKYIGNGWGLIMDQFYDIAEAEQAYVYDRFDIGSTGQDNPDLCMQVALMWASSLLGLLTALPSANIRRIVSAVVAGFGMVAFAYYGVIPSWICIAVLAAALAFVLSRGSFVSSLTVLLAALIVFGAVALIDPGESYGISRADENFRDRFALRSSYLDGGTSQLDSSDLDTMQDQQDQDRENNGKGFLSENKWVAAIIIIVLILAALGATGWIFMKRLRKRQAANRAGIDSADPREAIIAMFPYAVRWLQPAGIDVAGKTFVSLTPMIRADVSEQYAERYTNMYELWKEAAYSDHEMTEDRRGEMKNFLGDTMKMISDRSDIGAKIRNTVKYAL